MTFNFSLTSLFILLLTNINTFGQNSIEETLQKYNTGAIPYIYVEELETKYNNKEDFIILDSRSKEEYNVSHLEDAVWVGFKSFDKSRVKNIDKDAEIVIYCSVGVRSEKIGIQLKNLGFTNIKNLYGGIFLWTNTGLPVYTEEESTKNVHPYNKQWGKLIEN